MQIFALSVVMDIDFLQVELVFHVATEIAIIVIKMQIFATNVIMNMDFLQVELVFDVAN